MVDDLIEDCREWSEVIEDDFELDSGEKVHSKSHFQYFDKKKEDYINWRQVMVNGKIFYEGRIMVEGKDETKGTGSHLSEKDAQLLKTIDEFIVEKRKIMKALPHFQKILSEDFEIESLVTEKTFSVKIQDEAIFGDIKDIYKLESRLRAGKKSIKRPFHPGNSNFM